MDIPSMRLKNQHISAVGTGSAREVVATMGALQAQDLPMAKWAVGLRLQGATIETIEAAINEGDILRTHALRPTWHLVAAEDIYWMLELSAPQIKGSLKTRHSRLELTASTISKANKILESMLRGGKQLPREVLVNEFKKAGIRDEDNRAAHLLMLAELEGIICSGSTSGAKQSYALLEEKVPTGKRLNKEESLATLASRYFTSRGPATLQDFVWWSGLYVTDAKRGLEMIKAELDMEKLGSQTYWFGKESSQLRTAGQPVHLLPAFDEFIISYKDRSASMPVENHNRAISSNGIFRPVILVNGKAEGIWRRVTKGQRVEVEADFFEKPLENTREAVEKAATNYGRFLGKEIGVIFLGERD